MPPAERSTDGFARRSDWLVIALVVCSLPAIAYGLMNVRTDTSDVTQWLPASTEERARYEWFVRHFGVDQYLIVSWDGSRPDDARLTRFAEVVRARLSTRAAGQYEPLVKRVVTTAELLDRLEAPELGLSSDEARRRLSGILLGPANDTAAVLIEVTRTGKLAQVEVMDAVYQIAQDEIGLDKDHLIVGGSIFEAVTIDEESLGSLRTFAMPAGILVAVVALACVRDIRLAALMLAISVYCQCLSIAVIYYCGTSLNAVLIVMPTLVYVITMSGALHLVNYYRAALAQREADPAAWTLKHGWQPCLWANVTTAMGLGSLVVSQVEPVRLFGFYTALNVLLAVGVLLAVIPSALRVLALRRTAAMRMRRRQSQRLAGSYTAWVARRHAVVTVVSVAMVAVAAVGLGRLKTSLNLQQMFPHDSRLVRNYAWLEREVGPLISIEMVLAFAKASDIDLLTQLETVSAVEERLRESAEIGATTSGATFVPIMPEANSLRALTQRVIFRRRLEAHRSDFQADGVFSEDRTHDLWRVTARVSALAGLEYGALTDRLRGDVDRLLAGLDPTVRTALTIHYTGLTPIIYRAQQQILADLFWSFVSAFVLICPVMMFHFRSIAGGLVAMIPNVSPVVVVFGMLGWLGVPLDIGVVLTASVGLGIAVDGTLHFVGWFGDCRRRGMSRNDALLNTFRTCSTAMMQTTLICGLGMLVFALSHFLPTARFAWLLISLLVVALAGDLVLMPSLLAGWLGHLFEPPPPASHAIDDLVTDPDADSVVTESEAAT